MLAGLGMTVDKIAAIMGVAENTLRSRKDILDLLDRGRAKAESIVGKSLFERAKDGDVAAIRWWEMTRAGRTEASRQAIDFVNKTPPQPLIIQIGGQNIDPKKLGWIKDDG